MVHFDLVKYFGYPYAKDNGASLGVPIVDHVLKLDENQTGVLSLNVMNSSRKS